ncbi:hypothetical protein WN944_029056 [Citrus x changshan-huyou]|uniref:Uncharacterized protein n=1 Tax=Citrus x changshan-huyou TaxID=2935761 RepID=A0AAP0LKH4_9ROSI
MERHKRLVIGYQLVSDELKMLREKSEVNHLKNYFSESKENFLEVQIIVEDVNRDLECEKVRVIEKINVHFSQLLDDLDSKLQGNFFMNCFVKAYQQIDVVTYNIMIYGLRNDLFFDVEAKGVSPDFVIFNSLMHGFIWNNVISCEAVIELLHKIKAKNAMPDASIVSIVEDSLVKNEI